jgi:hypothetical protein
MTPSSLRSILAAGLLAGTANLANAGPRRLVVLDFDGPRDLAAAGRSAVVTALGDHHDVVATRRWEQARHAAARKVHGPRAWETAAKSAKVDAVIEGWVEDDGRRYIMTIAVREAATGNQIDAVSVKLDDKGVTESVARQLRADLEELLEWVGDEISPGARREELDDRIDAPATVRVRERERDRDEGIEERREVPEIEGIRGRDDEERGEEDRDDEADVERDKRATDAAFEAESDSNAPGANRGDDLISIFGKNTKEADTVAKKAPRQGLPPYRFALSAGPYFASRSLTFTSDYAGDDPMSPIDYPSTGLKGATARAQFFPMPSAKYPERLNGIGARLDVARSMGSTFPFEAVDGTIEDYPVTQIAWSAAAAYRLPFRAGTVEASGGYGVFGHHIDTLGDDDLEIPDTDYRYLEIGGRAEAALGAGAIGFGGRYLYILDAGDPVTYDWFGPATAWGFILEGDLRIPVTDRFYAHGALVYRRFQLAFIEDGDDLSAIDAADGTLSGDFGLGVNF